MSAGSAVPESHRSRARIGGVAALGAVLCHVVGLVIFTAGATRNDVDLAMIAGPPTVAGFAELSRMHGYVLAAVWVGIVSWLLMGIAVLGPLAALAGRSRLAGPAAVLCGLGLVAGTLHFGPDAVYWTVLPARVGEATGALRDFHLQIAFFLRDLSAFYERIWGLARGAGILLFALALGRTFGWRRWFVIMSGLGGLEFVLRLPAIAAEAPMSFVFDATYVAWLTSMGVWLTFGLPPAPADQAKSDPGL